MGFKRGQKWPAPVEYFKSGPIGFVYVIQMWFRYYVGAYHASLVQKSP
jgi:hypothetical protein